MAIEIDKYQAQALGHGVCVCDCYSKGSFTL